MTYEKGQKILANDYNNFVGVPTGSPSNSNKTKQPFNGPTEAQNTVAGIYGVGYGDRGYGQSSADLYLKQKGDPINSDDWVNLRQAIFTCAQHQGTSTNLLPPSNDLNSGQPVEAHEQDSPSSDAYDFQNSIENIDQNRLNVDSGASLTLSTNEFNNQRGSGWASVIDTTFSASFPDEDEARFFFNSGGRIKIRFSHPNGSSPQDDEWRRIFGNEVGTVVLEAKSASRTGSGGSITGPDGYYDLSSSFQLVYNGVDIGSGAYTSNDVYISVRYSGGTTVNGARGHTLEFNVSLRDEHTGFEDSVSSGTQVTVDVDHALSSGAGGNSPLIDIKKPNWNLVDGF